MYRVQNFFVIGWAYFELEHSKFWSNFEFDRNTVSGRGACIGIFFGHPADAPWGFINATHQGDTALTSVYDFVMVSPSYWQWPPGKIHPGVWIVSYCILSLRGALRLYVALLTWGFSLSRGHSRWLICHKQVVNFNGFWTTSKQEQVSEPLHIRVTSQERVPNHRQIAYFFFNSLFRSTTKKISKFRVTDPFIRGPRMDLPHTGLVMRKAPFACHDVIRVKRVYGEGSQEESSASKHARIKVPWPNFSNFLTSFLSGLTCHA